MITLLTMVAVTDSAQLTDALQDTWQAIADAHPDLHDVHLTITTVPRTQGTGVTGTWTPPIDGQPALLELAGVDTTVTGRDVLGAMLHGAAHALATARDITDTSRQGRYHNRAFVKLAEEVGLTVGGSSTATTGYSDTSPTLETLANYPQATDALTAALPAPAPEFNRPARRAGSDNGVAAECGCGRRIRIGKTVLELGVITCNLCGKPFTESKPGKARR